jgi:tetratricopeptide (TPR) repeat protein
MIWKSFIFLIIFCLTTETPVTVAQDIEELFSKCDHDLASRKWVGAKSLFPKAVESEPRNAAEYFNKGNLLSQEQKYEEAIAAYRKAIRIKSDFAEAYDHLGNLLQIKPDFAEPYYHVGYVPDYVLNEQRKYEETIAAYRKAIQIKPDYDQAYFHLGNFLIDRQKYKEAIGAYRNAILLNPFKYSTALYQLQIYNKFIAGSKEALELQAIFSIANNSKETQQHLVFRDNPSPQITNDSYFLPEPSQEPRLALLPSMASILDSYFLPEPSQEPRLAALRSTASILDPTSLVPTPIGAGWVVKRENNTLWIVTNTPDRIRE